MEGRPQESHTPQHLLLLSSAQQHLGRLAAAWENVHTAWDIRIQTCARELQHHLTTTALPQIVKGCRRPLPLAAVSIDGTRKQGRSYTEEERAEARREIEGMAPEQREALAAAAWEAVLRSRKVKVDGRKVDLRTLMQELMEEQAMKNSGAGVWQDRGTEPWLVAGQLQADEIRPGYSKQMLFPDQEEALGLRRLGIGVVWSKHGMWLKHVAPFLGKLDGVRDVVYGIYAEPDAVREQLSGMWAGVEPSRVLTRDEYYEHVVATAPETQLTLVAQPCRDLPLEQSAQVWVGRLRQRMAALPGGLTPGDEQALEQLRGSFDARRLDGTGLTTTGDSDDDEEEGGGPEGEEGGGGGGRGQQSGGGLEAWAKGWRRGWRKKVPREEREVFLRDGARLIFSTTQEGNLAAEAITPGALREQQRVYLGLYHHPRLAYAVWDMLLGEQPVDDLARRMVGNNALYALNGFKFGLNPDNPFQLKADPDRPFEEPTRVEQIPAKDISFELPPTGTRKLLKAIRRAKIKSHPVPEV